MCFDKVGLKMSTYYYMGEIMLHSEELGLGTIFSVVQLNSSSLYIGQLVLVCLVPMHVSDNPQVFKVNESVVDKELTGG